MPPKTLTPVRTRRLSLTAVVAAAVTLPLVLPLSVVTASAADALPSAACPPLTPGHDCSDLAPDLPLDLDFTSPTDLGAFTMLQSSTTGTYKPENLTVDTSGTGTLRVTTTKGSNYLGATGTPAGNSLDNGLGIGLDGTRKTTASITLSDFPVTSNMGEAFGMWFGPGEDDYVKLTATATSGGKVKPQLVREVGGASSTADEKGWRTLTVAGGSITLTMVADPVAGTVSGSYQVPGSDAVDLGSLTVPAEFFQLPGQTAATPGSSTFLGLFASQRRRSTPLTVGIDRFTVNAEGGTPAAVGSLALLPGDAEPGDRLVFNKVQHPKTTTQRMHSTAGVTLKNTGTTRATVTSLTTTGPFAVSGVTLPLTLQPGQSVPATVSFTATGGDLSTGTLDVAGSGTTASLPLAGFWQNYNEGSYEPTLPELVQLFGYQTVLPSRINRAGAYKAWSSDEVLSPYWRARDAAKPVTVTQLAAYHTYPSYGYLRWFDQGAPTTLRTALVHSNLDAQSVLPKSSRAELADATGLATSSFTPSGAFGFKADNEFGDPTLNNDSVDRSKGCTATVCGHHLRVFQVRDAAGNVVPGSYLLAQDLQGINYDYEDNVFLVENVIPAG